MKITKYNSQGCIESEFDYAIEIPNYVSEYISNRIPYIISPEEEKVLDSGDSVKKIILIEKLERIINNDYRNFLDFSKKHNVFTFCDDSVRSLVCQCKNLTEHLKSANEKFAKVKSDYRRLSSKISHYDSNSKQENCNVSIDELHKQLCIVNNVYNNTCSEISYLVDSLKRIIQEIKKGFPSEMKSFSKLEREITFSDDIIVSLFAKLLGKMQPEHRALIYLLNEASEQILRSENKFHEQPSQQNVSFVQRKEKENGNLYWRIEFNPKEILSILVSEEKDSEVVLLLKNLLEKGYSEYKEDNGENCRESVVNEAHDHFETFSLSPKEWEFFYFYKKKNLIKDSDINSDTLKTIPDGLYMVLLKNDVIDKLYSFNDELVIDLLFVTGNRNYNGINYIDFYRKMFEFNFIKGLLGITKDNTKTIIQEESFDTEKKSQNASEALRYIMYFLKPILNEKYIGNLDIHKVVELLREVFLSDEIGEETILKGVTHCQCFNLKIVCQIIGLLMDRKLIDYKKDLDRKNIIVFDKGQTAFNIISHLKIRHNIGINPNNFSKYIRDSERELSVEIIMYVDDLCNRYL